MRRLLSDHLRPYRWQIVLVLVLALVQALANLYLPDLNANIINNGVAKGDTAYIVRMGGIMLVVTLLLGMASVVLVYWGSKTAMVFGRDVRGALFRKVESFSQTEVNQFGTPSLITRNTNDVQQVQMVVAHGAQHDDPRAAHGGRRHHHGAAPRRAALGHACGHPAGHGRVPRADHREGAAAVPCHAGEARPHQPGHARDALGHARHPRVRPQRLRGAPFDEANAGPHRHRPCRCHAPLRAHVPVAHRHHQPLHGRHHVVRRHRVASGGMPIGNLTAFLTYVMQILYLGDDGDVHARHGAACGRLGRPASSDVLDTEPPSVTRVPLPVPSIDKGRRGHRSSSRTSSSATRVPRTPFSGISRSRRRPGETTAIVGSTGSGKSTLISLIPRFYDVTGGSILIDGIDIRDHGQGRSLGQARVRPAEGLPVLPAPSRATFATATRTPPTRSSGTRSPSRRARTS